MITNIFDHKQYFGVSWLTLVSPPKMIIIYIYMYTYIFLQVVGNYFGTQTFFLSWHVRQWNKRHPHAGSMWSTHVIHGPWILMDFGVGIFGKPGSWILVLRCTRAPAFSWHFLRYFFVILSCLPVRRLMQKALKPAFATATVVFIYSSFSWGYLDELNDNDPHWKVDGLLKSR